MEHKDIQTILSERIIPEAHHFSLNGDGQFMLANGASIRLEAPKKLLVLAQNRLKKYWGITADITVDAQQNDLPPEAYSLQITPALLTIRTTTEDGLRHAFRTLRMLAEPERGTLTLSGNWLLPECSIDDAPALSFRGLHLCVFPETRFLDIAKKIRYAAYLKFNYIVVEFWGTFPFQSHPELAWDEFAHPRDQWAELIAEMREQEGVTLIPQLNILGHAPGSRSCTAQHVVLNRHPELAPLFEPDGWCWCLTNPETRKFLSEAVLEMHDFFGRPPFFHIGCDEADCIATCAECRKHSTSSLIHDHIQYFHDLLAQRDTKLIMWHDMLLSKNDPRWANYIATGQPFHHTEGLIDELPKDIILADWQYGYNFNKLDGAPTYPTSKYLLEKGFNVIACPWRKLDVIASFGEFARNNHLFGLLETTWHIFYGHELKGMFYSSAQAAWGISHKMEYGAENVVKAWRQIVTDMGIQDYNDIGVSDFQVIPSTYGSLQ